ncbi:cell cycle checkpoint [Pyrrhoderma noxium]|uniref:Checkpoint protein n=1 Tax=Pyrrhoderma noxium TaxID=2282107 RepID=A0A286UA80_9AGAM|nr:cell cycle checkpoint [Pyrrhoderma noxium]
MRFRANIDHVQTFSRILQAVEKLQKRCIMRFTETEMHIICNEESEDGVQVWSQIKVDSLFTEYRIQSNSNNEINLHLSPEALLQALRSASPSNSNPASNWASKPSGEVVIKLAKKHNHAVLSVEIALALNYGGLGGSSRQAMVVHDVPVEVLKPSDIEKLREPLCPEPDIHVLLPPLQKIRTVTERMKSMAELLGIHANRRGVLQLSLESDQVRTKTQWTRCTIPNMSSTQDQSLSQSSIAQNTTRSDSEINSDPEHLYGVHVSNRAFLKFLSSHVVSTTTIACICENHCMILYVYIGEVSEAGGVLTFYIPARITGDD